jgi:hyaluronate lyase
MLLVYTRDIERYRDGYFAIVDPYRFPGVTVERFARSEGDGGGANPGKKGGSNCVGGATLGTFGAAAMYVKPAVGVLEAHKAWFFVDDQIVNLGAGIGVASDNNVETTVENARLVSPSQELHVDGKRAADGAAAWQNAKWAYLTSSQPKGNLGWVLLDGNVALNTIVESRTGSRADVQKNWDATPITMRFATLWFDHGKHAQNGSYAYVTLLGRSEEDVKQYAASPAITVLANTPEIQAVRVPSRALVAASICTDKDATVGDITCQGRAIVLATDAAGELRLAVSDPTQEGQEIRLACKSGVRQLISKDDAVKVESLNPLVFRINVKAAGGKTFQAAFAK